MPDALGITHISDLSPVDLEKVRSLAFLELSITFEDHDIPLKLKKPAKVKNTSGTTSMGLIHSFRKVMIECP